MRRNGNLIGSYDVDDLISNTLGTVIGMGHTGPTSGSEKGKANAADALLERRVAFHAFWFICAEGHLTDMAALTYRAAPYIM